MKLACTNCTAILNLLHLEQVLVAKAFERRRQTLHSNVVGSAIAAHWTRYLTP